MRRDEALARVGRSALAGASVWVALSLASPGPAAAGEPAEPPLPPLAEARPALPPAPEPAPVPWQQHLEIGAGVSLVEMPASVDGDGKATPIRFKPGVGFHVDLSWQVCRFFRFTGYVLEHDHPIAWGSNPLGLGGTPDGSGAHAYSFGARFSPTLPIGKRVRVWITAGAGWGRVEYGRYTVVPVAQPPQGSFSFRERAESLFEVPVGLGGAIEIIPRWLSLHVEVTGAFVPSQIGDALGHGQYIDNRGLLQDLPPMPKLDASFVQSIGLSLHL